jgi:hypothetical protein
MTNTNDNDCQFVTAHTNPKLTVFSDNTRIKTKLRNKLYSKKSYKISLSCKSNNSDNMRARVNSFGETSITNITTGKLLCMDIHTILVNLNINLGPVSWYSYMNSVIPRKGNININIEFEYWHDTPFTNKLHSELVINYEFNRINHSNYPIELTLGNNLYIIALLVE